MATIRLWAPAILGVDVAVCARTFRWEWWTLFFEFAILVSALVATALPERLVRARFPLATLLSAASVLIMVGLTLFQITKALSISFLDLLAMQFPKLRCAIHEFTHLELTICMSVC